MGWPRNHDLGNWIDRVSFGNVGIPPAKSLHPVCGEVAKQKPRPPLSPKTCSPPAPQSRQQHWGVPPWFSQPPPSPSQKGTSFRSVVEAGCASRTLVGGPGYPSAKEARPRAWGKPRPPPPRDSRFFGPTSSPITSQSSLGVDDLSSALIPTCPSCTHRRADAPPPPPCH